MYLQILGLDKRCVGAPAESSEGCSVTVINFINLLFGFVFNNVYTLQKG